MQYFIFLKLFIIKFNLLIYQTESEMTPRNFQFGTFVMVMLLTCEAKNPPIRVSDLKSPGFMKTIMNITQTYRNADLYCKAEVGQYFYYSHTGRCERCEDLCYSDTAQMQCWDKCQNYLSDMKYNQTINQLTSQVQVLRIVCFVSVAVGVVLCALFIGFYKSLKNDQEKMMANFEKTYSKKVHGVVEGDRNIGNRNDEIHGPTQEQTNLINGTNNQQQARVFVDEESAYGSRTSFESGNI